MDKVLEYGGNAAGLLGILICLVAGVARLFGAYFLWGFEVASLIMGGTALMVMACLFKLHQLSMKAA